MLLHRAGQRGDEVLDRERPVQADLEHADLLAARDEVLDGFLGGFRARAHEDDDALGIRRADVIEQLVLAAGELRELVHRVLHDGRAGQVERVHGLARLEVDVGVLRGAAEDGLVGRERARAVGARPDRRRSSRAGLPP